MKGQCDVSTIENISCDIDYKSWILKYKTICGHWSGAYNDNDQGYGHEDNKDQEYPACTLCCDNVLATSCH